LKVRLWRHEVSVLQCSVSCSQSPHHAEKSPHHRSPRNPKMSLPCRSQQLLGFPWTSSLYKLGTTSARCSYQIDPNVRNDSNTRERT
jgi:hypothetical protein